MPWILALCLKILKAQGPLSLQWRLGSPSVGHTSSASLLSQSSRGMLALSDFIKLAIYFICLGISCSPPYTLPPSVSRQKITLRCLLSCSVGKGSVHASSGWAASLSLGIWVLKKAPTRRLSFQLPGGLHISSCAGTTDHCAPLSSCCLFLPFGRENGGTMTG